MCYICITLLHLYQLHLSLIYLIYYTDYLRTAVIESPLSRTGAGLHAVHPCFRGYSTSWH